MISEHEINITENAIETDTSSRFKPTSINSSGNRKNSIYSNNKYNKDQKPNTTQLRMLDQPHETNAMKYYNTHNKLLELSIFNNTDLIESQNIPNYVQKTSRQKNHFRKKFFLSSLCCCFIILIIFELFFLLIGMFFTTDCVNVGNYLILSALSHFILIICETIRSFLRQIYTGRDSRKYTDGCLIFLILIVGILLLFSCIWFALGFTWIWIPYTEMLFNRQNYSISIIHDGKDTRIILRQCTLWVLHVAMFYQVYCVFVFLFRIIFCCFGNSLSDIMLKIMEKSNSNFQVTYVATNKLHEFIPTLKIINNHHDDQAKQSNYGLVHDNAHCMVSNHPKWVNL